MTDPFAEMKAALDALEERDRERYRSKQPEQEPPVSPARAYLDRLNASRGPVISVDSRWLQ
jgi:hypothetical protein